MPEISSLPAMPAVAGAGPIAGVGAAPAVAPEADAAGLSFLATLKTALASLASAVPQIAATTVSPAPVAEEPLLEEVPAEPDTRPDDTTPAMPEVLAALGFLPVSTLLPTPTQPEPVPSDVHVSASTPQGVALRVAQPVAEPAPPTDAAPAPRNDAKPLYALTPELTPVDATPAHLKAAAEQLATQAVPAAHLQTADAQPTPHDLPTPQTAPVVSAPVAQHAAAQHFGDHGASADDADRDDRTPATEIASASTSQSIEPRIEAAAAGITTSAPIASAALPPHVRPSEVVNQIAHQAELYRLPGNKGVRIQLHPEDLGGVDVTLRYSTAGGIQLHINVEHASTGALVQAGWNELRDALATQGITPDRLIMSVTAPGNASASDFSSNNSGGGSYRGDAGQMSFDQQGQRQGGEPEAHRVTRVWRDDSATHVDDNALAVVSSARIDYRI